MTWGYRHRYNLYDLLRSSAWNLSCHWSVRSHNLSDVSPLLTRVFHNLLIERCRTLFGWVFSLLCRRKMKAKVGHMCEEALNQRRINVYKTPKYKSDLGTSMKMDWTGICIYWGWTRLWNITGFHQVPFGFKSTVAKGASHFNLQPLQVHLFWSYSPAFILSFGSVSGCYIENVICVFHSI